MPSASSSVLSQFNSSVLPLATAGAIVSWPPKAGMLTVKPGLDLAQAISSVLSLAIAAPRPSLSAEDLGILVEFQQLNVRILFGKVSFSRSPLGDDQLLALLFQLVDGGNRRAIRETIPKDSFMYGLAKSTFSLRSSVTVKLAIMISTLLDSR